MNNRCQQCGGTHEPPVARCVRLNGFANYPTWIVALWLDNSQDSQRFWAEYAKAVRRHADPLRVLAEKLKEAHASVPFPAVYGDLLSYALDQVDWHELASHLLADDSEDCK